MKIAVTNQRSISKQYNITSNMIKIGRGPDNNIVIPDKKVSRNHLAIIKDKNTYKIRDLGSRNGTYINGKKIISGKIYSLSESDIIKIGDKTLTISPTKSKTETKKKFLIPLAIALSAVVIIAIALTIIFINKAKESQSISTEPTVVQEEIKEEEEPEQDEAVSEITEEDTVLEGSLDIDRILQQVVDIHVITNDNLEGGGSGTIYSSDGYIITNYHVIEGANIIDVKTHDGKKYAAEIIFTNKEIDIALLKINAQNLVPADFGNSSDLKLGDEVIAIGSPYELSSTITKGIVSSRRDIEFEDIKIINAIQHDAAINPGNSGGPLINSKGEVVGINSFIMSPDYSNTGLNFAIPIDLVLEKIDSF